ncbi:MAG: hypothetical protein WC547_06420 [Candidatus Omnitrophota bacterium]
MPGYIDILKALNAHKIRYIVIGGLAVNLHGIPRMTYDIDLLIDFDISNIKKLEMLMNTLGFKPKAPVAICDLADQNKRNGWIKQKNMKAFNLVNPSWAVSEIDILIDAPVTYNKAKNTAKKISIEGIAIPVISIQNLIKMKRSSARDQDIRDIKYLKKVSHEK